MKKYIKYWCLFIYFLFLPGFCFGYEQEGFSHYYEGVDGVSFNCVKECTITVGEKNKIDYLYLSGILNGSGIIGYGFYDGNDFSFLSKYKFTESSNIKKFADLMAYNLQFYQKSTDLFLLISGDVQGNIYLQTGNLSFLQKIDLAWNNFWEMEVFDQYGLNLRYGVFIRGVSVIIYGYIVFILISLGILLKKGKQKFKSIFYVGLGLFLLIGIRNTVTYTFSLKEGLSGFKADKIYFELGDYFSFVDKIRNQLDLSAKDYTKNDCKILLEYGTGFNYGPLDIYFKPCELASTGLVNYKIYYKKEIPPEDLDKIVLIDFNGSYLLENKLK